MTSIFTPSSPTRVPTSGIRARLPHIHFTAWGMESRGGTSSVKRVDVDKDSSELSVSTASNTTLPHLEATDAERALDDNERRRKKEARKLKREAREKKKEA